MALTLFLAGAFAGALCAAVPLLVRIAQLNEELNWRARVDDYRAKVEGRD